MLGDAVGYRDSRTAGMDEKVYEIIPEEKLYERTGIQKQIFNTIYQLMAVKSNNPEILEHAETMLMIPEYFNYLLTGEKASEYTNATTTQLVSPETKDWDYELIEMLGYPKQIFQKIKKPGTVLGNLTKEIQKEVGFDCEVVLPATHDTGSAVMAVPTNEDNIISIEQIIAEPHDPKLVKPCVESKVFGIGVESYTAGSAEFTLTFAATHENVLPLMDNGHYHPTEVVSDKIPALLCYFPEIALHITRPVRWDSDHVVLFDDETKEMAKEIVRCDAIDRVHMALDYFDASINRISAWTVGFRSWQKALLSALCTPNAELKKLQDENRLTELMVMQEELKTFPFGDVWTKYCEECGVPADKNWFEEVERYEKEVLLNR